MADNRREEANTGLNGADALDTLKRYGQVVEGAHHGGTAGEHGEEGHHDVALDEDAGRHCGGLRSDDLHRDVAYHENESYHGERDDPAVVPGVFRATHIKNKQETNNAAEERHKTRPMELLVGM